MKRSKFSLSHYRLFSCDMGELVPIGLTEVLAGDSIQHSTSAFLRCSPLLAPVMHPVDVRISHWFVPFRLIWEDWEDFITGGPTGTDASVFPTITLTYGAGPPVTGNNTVGSLADYLGVPPAINNLEVSALPFRAYALIWNEWFRDQDLQTELVIDETSGPDTTTNTTLQNVNWEKDYFTSARPWEQKGPAITLPLGSRANVKGLGFEGSNANLNANINVRETGGSGTVQYPFSQNAGDFNPTIYAKAAANVNPPFPDIYADLTGASAITVGALREAMALQRYEEARARYGSRYVEYLRYLGIRSSDARLQRPEYLGGGRQRIQFSEVLQTAEGTDPVGEMKGHGIAAMRSNRYRKFFEEHGYIVSCMSVKPKTMYAQGLRRTWNRRFKEDFWQRELQHIGQQPIENRELYAQHAAPLGTFGYQDRYDEYRRTESGIAGEFRTTLLDFWHMARIFSSDPALNASFVSSVPTERVFAVPSQDVLWIQANHSMQARRLVSASGTSFIF